LKEIDREVESSRPLNTSQNAAILSRYGGFCSVADALKDVFLVANYSTKARLALFLSEMDIAHLALMAR
jgi:hypothetical protein